MNPNLSRLVLAVDDTNAEGKTQITMTQEGAEMLMQGYLCGRCLEDLTLLGAFPAECPVCHFPVAQEQISQFKEQFKGKQHIGSRVSLADELAQLGEMYIPPGGITY